MHSSALHGRGGTHSQHETSCGKMEVVGISDTLKLMGERQDEVYRTMRSSGPQASEEMLSTVD